MREDTSSFQFDVMGQTPQSFEVQRFASVVPHALSEDYAVAVEVLNSTSIALETLVGQRSRLLMVVGDHTHFLHGVITHAESYGCPTSKSDRIIFSSPLHGLKNTPRCRVYRALSIPEIVENILVRAGWERLTYAFLLSHVYEKRPFTLQYQESDYEFLIRLLNFYGLFFTFQQKETHAVLCVTDDISTLPARLDTDVFKDDNFYDTQINYSVLPEKIALTDYDENSPHAPLNVKALSQSSVPGWGEQHRVLEHFTSHEAGTSLATMRMEAWDSARRFWQGKVNRVLHPGMKVEIQNHPQKNRNGIFSVIAVQHRGNQDQMSPVLRYQCEVTLIPSTQAYRSLYHPSFFMPPCVATVGDLDDQGRYTITHEYDEAGANISNFAVPRAQLLAGKDYGMHFPYAAGTKVVLLHVNGDPDRPVIFSALPEKDQKINEENLLRHATLRSHAGNILQLEDHLERPQILFGQSQYHGLRLTDPPGASRIAMLSEGALALQSASDLVLKAGETLSHTVSAQQEVQVGGNYFAESQHDSIQFEAGRHLMLSAPHQTFSAAQDARIISEDEMILSAADQKWDVQKNIILRAGKSFSVESNDHISLQTSEKGSLQFSQADAQITLSQNHIEIVSPKAIYIDADRIETTGVQKLGKNSNPANAQKIVKNSTQKIARSGRGVPFEDRWVQDVPNDRMEASSSEKGTPVPTRGQFFVDEEEIPPPTQGQFFVKITDDTGFPWQKPTPYSLHDNTKSHVICEGIVSSEIHAEIEPDQKTLKIEMPGSRIISVGNKNQAPHFQAMIPSKETQITCLRGNKMLQVGELLDDDTLQYFQRKGNNVTIFVHGFNVALGLCGREFLDATVSTDLIPQRTPPDQVGAPASVYFSYSPYVCSILRTWAEVRAHLPQVPERVTSIDGAPCYNEEVRDSFVNGTGAYHWMQHMSYNLNCAAVGTYPFPWEKRAKEYTPILALAWPGNVGLIHFQKAISNAMRTAHAFCSLLRQLKSAGLAINVIAHSLGCRVTLEAMKSLATENGDPFFDHVFLWQAAVPNDALSREFRSSLNAAQHITILYSDHDLILALPYHAGQADALHLQALLQDKPALGYTGPIFDQDRSRDPLWHRIQRGQVMLVPQSGWLVDHSGMKIPDPNLFEHVYKGIVVGGNGLRRFGNYAL